MLLWSNHQQNSQVKTGAFAKTNQNLTNLTEQEPSNG